MHVLYRMLMKHSYVFLQIKMFRRLTLQHHQVNEQGRLGRAKSHNHLKFYVTAANSTGILNAARGPENSTEDHRSVEVTQQPQHCDCPQLPQATMKFFHRNEVTKLIAAGIKEPRYSKMETLSTLSTKRLRSRGTRIRIGLDTNL